MSQPAIVPWPADAEARPLVHALDPSAHWSFSLVPASGPRLKVKRIVDIAGALLLLALALPVLVALALLIRVTSRGPAFFRQRRVGLHCGDFFMYKLRTMVHGADRHQDRLAARQQGRTFLKIVNDPRVTPLGRLLRRLSLDELPQLYNVLKGDMSLVGPRPLLPCDFRKFPKHEQLRRFAMKPGLTGLWQVSGRSALSDAERIRLDLRYVDHWSVWLDLKILARTLPAVLSTRGAT